MFKTNKLKSGLEVIAAPVKGTKTVTVLAMVATGSRFENRQNSGLSHFLEHMFFKGTIKRPTTLAISSALDRVGGEFNAFTGKEYTGYFVKVAAEYLELALDVLSDMLLNSKFDEAEIEREKGVVIEELNMYLDNPVIYIEDLFEECLYGDTPAGRDTIGTRESIAGFNRAQILNYFGTQYGADKMIVSLAGQFKPEAIKLVGRYFKDLKEKKYQDKLATNNEQSGPKLNVHYKATDQAHLSLGVRAAAYNEPDELATKIIAIILGGSMSSRLFTELRERRGLAYYVRSHHEPYTDSGYLTTQAGVPIKKLPEAVKIILAEYEKIITKPIAAEELNRVKQYIIGRTALQLEASDSVASWYGRQAILLKEQARSAKVEAPEEYFKKIKNLTAAEINRVAKNIFVNSKLNLAVIGPYKKTGELEKLLHI